MARFLLVAFCTSLAVAQVTVNQVVKTPYVVTPGVDATLTVEYWLTGTVDRVALNPVWANTTEVDFVRSGTGRWRISFPVSQWLETNQGPHVYRPFIGFVRAYSGGTRLIQFNLVGEIAPVQIPRVALTRVAADFQHTPYVANINLPRAFPDPALAPPVNFPNRMEITRRFYQVFPDEFDQLDLVYVPDVPANRNHTTIQNKVQGIGLPLLPTGFAEWGSAGRLQGVNAFPISSFFDHAENASLHEFGHQWINQLRFGPFAVGAPHWPISTMARGIMGLTIPGGVGGNFPCDLQLESGQLRVFTPTALRVFTDLDLYLMGLLGPEQVADQYLITDPAVASAATSNACNAPTPAGSWVTIRPADVIAGAGPRLPGASASQNEFRRGTIVVSRDGLLSESAMALYTYFARRGEDRAPVLVKSGVAPAEMQNPFFLATRRRATMSTQLRTANWPTITAGGVVNGASGSTSIGQGSYVALYGERLISADAVSTPSTTLPRTLADVTVYVNGERAPLYFVSDTQVNFQLPFEVPVGKASVSLVSRGGPSNAAWIDVTAAAPGIIVYGNNRAAAQNADGSVNTPEQGAQPGSVVTAYLTGIGPLSTPVATGVPAPANPLARATLAARATVGGQAAMIEFLGLTPGFAGLAQVNLSIPARLAPGDHPLQVTIGTAASNAPLIRVSP